MYCLFYSLKLYKYPNLLRHIKKCTFIIFDIWEEMFFSKTQTKADNMCFVSYSQTQPNKMRHEELVLTWRVPSQTSQSIHEKTEAQTGQKFVWAKEPDLEPRSMGTLLPRCPCFSLSSLQASVLVQLTASLSNHSGLGHKGTGQSRETRGGPKRNGNDGWMDGWRDR